MPPTKAGRGSGRPAARDVIAVGIVGVIFRKGVTALQLIEKPDLTIPWVRIDKDPNRNRRRLLDPGAMVPTIDKKVTSREDILDGPPV
jgi:hypothetical protein